MESIIINSALFLIKVSILYVVIWDAVKNGIISAQKYRKETDQNGMTSQEVLRKWEESRKKKNNQSENR